jgi:hypothetical protein
MEDYKMNKIIEQSQRMILAKRGDSLSSPYIIYHDDNFLSIEEWEGDEDEGDDVLVENWYRWDYTHLKLDYIGEEMPLI